MDKKELQKRAATYCKLSGTRLIPNPALGHGTDGSVWRSTGKTAVKAFYYEKNYHDELECYKRLQNAEITQIKELAVPALEGSSLEFLVVEMSIVQPPYLLDFGKVYIDRPPPYASDAQCMSNWHAEVRDLFEDRASEVYIVLHILKKLGIHYVDPKPANICF